MRCARCGHDNPELNRFCGMCGFPLETKAEAAKETPPTAGPAAVGGSRSSTSILGLDVGTVTTATDQPRSAVAGPSFLGLNDEPDPRYLLEDEDEGLGGHVGLLVVSVLLVAAAFAAFHYRGELSPRVAPLVAAVLERVNPKPPAPAPPPPAPAPEKATTAPTEPTPSAADAPPVAGTSPPASAEERPAPAADEKLAEPAQPAPESAEASAPKKKHQEPARYARTSRPKPAAEAAQDDPTLKLAQRYIRGQGVRQDCTTGMAYLREAMKRPSAAASSQMGALYATGTCVPLDRVAAYHWFSSALQMAPTNPWLARERDELYGQMTSAERRRADRQ